jgi:hypothetical protein
LYTPLIFFGLKEGLVGGLLGLVRLGLSAEFERVYLMHIALSSLV